MVPPRSQLGGSVMCAPCRAERQAFDQIFWAHNPRRKRPWEYWRSVREIEAEDRLRTLANAPPSPPPTAPDPHPNDPTDERNRKGGYEPGIFQFNESSVHTGRAYNSGNTKSVYDRDAARDPGTRPFAQRTLSLGPPVPMSFCSAHLARRKNSWRERESA